MASLDETLASHLKDAMRARDEVRLRTVRSLRAALKEKEISERQSGTAKLTPDQEIAVVQKQAKQRQDAIEQFRAAGREDLVQRESEELEIIQTYLPAALPEEEVRAEIRRIIESTGASSLKEIGRVMGPAMQVLRGRTDGSVVQRIAREELQARETGAAP
ncbi:MAG TPA: GatB/YqeY domain-containing protein [Rhodothermales bacterium]